MGLEERGIKEEGSDDASLRSVLNAIDNDQKIMDNVISDKEFQQILTLTQVN